MFDVKTLKEFYEYVSAPEGIRVTDFQNRLSLLFADQRTTIDIDDYRLGKKPWKKLRDEITPVARFLEFGNIEVDRVRFPLDNKTPDCWLIIDNGEYIGIEVTIERGREQFHLATELNKNGMGRGFIGIQDDASQTDFDRRMSNPHTMFTSDHALESTKEGILRCLSKKNAHRYENIYFLLIQAHLLVLPKERWSIIAGELSQVAKDLPFQEVHIIGDIDEEPWGFQIK
jgi:hypothetical protein